MNKLSVPLSVTIPTSSEQLLTSLNIANSDPREVNKLSVPVNVTIPTRSEQLLTSLNIAYSDPS